MAYPNNDFRAMTSKRTRTKPVFEAIGYDGTPYRRAQHAKHHDTFEMTYRTHTQSIADAILDHYSSNNHNSFSAYVWESGAAVAVTAWYDGEPSIDMPHGYGTWDVTVRWRVVETS